jgi:hypothetical protein
MKNTQQQLVIDDLNYCDTICNDTEAIVGGGGGKLWQAIKGAVIEKLEAKITILDDLNYGDFPTDETIIQAFKPLPWGIIRRLS